MLPPIPRQKAKNIHITKSPVRGATPPPTPSPSSKLMHQLGDDSPNTAKRRAQIATINAIVECTEASRDLIPGLADLMKDYGEKSGSTTSVVVAGAQQKVPDVTGDSSNSIIGHPLLPSTEAVKTAASKYMIENPPFVTMSVKDSAPQLKLEDPPSINVNEESSDKQQLELQRKLIVRGRYRGYRMSRATCGVSNGGCYYYEAVIDYPNSNSSNGRGVKRSFQETEQQQQQPNKIENESMCMNGHIRIGWATPLADLQAPVGYNEHSYAIRSIAGSRVHNSRREDQWGGESFGFGDVIGMAICLVDLKKENDDATNATIGKTSVDESEKSIEEKESGGMDVDEKPSTIVTSTLTNHIRFFKNGKPMGGDNGIAFDNIDPGTYHPAISCYLDSSSLLNFGPHFVYPPSKEILLDDDDMEVHPISGLCDSMLQKSSEEMIEGVVESIILGSDGKLSFFSKKTDESMESVFKELVKIELRARHEVYMRHLKLHTKEIKALRKERGLSTEDLL